MHNLDGLGYRDTTVVVTGAFSGMGEATARILGELGARVHAVDIKKPTIPHEHFYETDLSDPDQVRATAAKLRGIGPIDTYFSCAGVSTVLGALKCMLVNYIGTRQLIEEVLPSIADRGGIAIISSDAALGWQTKLEACLAFMQIDDPVKAKEFCEQNPDFLRHGYDSSKEMLLVWSQHFSVKLAKTRGIRINCIGPGPTKTPFMTAVSVRLPADYWEKFPYPLFNRPSTPEEQAWPLILLNSRLNAITTGGVLYTDQGFAAGTITGSIENSILKPNARGGGH